MSGTLDNTAYDADQLADLLTANSDAPTISEGEVARIVELAQQRADARGEESALDETQMDCLIATEWDGFAGGEFGYDNGSLNQFAMGVFEEDVSAMQQASLFTDAVVIQDGWLTTGDSRRSQIVEYEDTEFEGSDEGELWIPDKAAEYICIIGLSDELVHGDIELGEAM